MTGFQEIDEIERTEEQLCRLLGWTMECTTTAGSMNRRYWTTGDGPTRLTCAGKGDFRPLTRLVDAWLIVEWMQKQGHLLALFATAQGTFDAVFTPDGKINVLGGAEHANPAAAICYAALAYMKGRP